MPDVKHAGEGRLAFRSLSAVMNKEFIHIVRDPGTLVISLALPVFLLLLFGYALSLDVKDVPFCLVDMDRSSESRGFVESFTASGYFKLVGSADGESEARQLIDQGRCRMGMIVPTGFSRDL